MRPEQQYIDLFSQCEAMICQHSCEVMNAPRAAAFADFERLGFPTRKDEKYKYTDISKLFEPDYGLNLKQLDIPVNPYDEYFALFCRQRCLLRQGAAQVAPARGRPLRQPAAAGGGASRIGEEVLRAFGRYRERWRDGP